MAQHETNKVTVLLPQDEFARFDSYCRERAYKKSTLVARLIRQFLDLEGYQVRRDSPFDRLSKPGSSR